MVKHHSGRIQNVIQMELFKAQESIKIAVAWFTNDLLFQPLLLKLQTGVSVELILNHDEINVSDNNPIDFTEFVRLGGKLHWNKTKTLLHDKFCIIDERVVIYGSYNWTNKAEYNNESIAVAEDEQETADFYLKKFEDYCKRYREEAPLKVANKNGFPANHLPRRNNPKPRIVKPTENVEVPVVTELYIPDGTKMITGEMIKSRSKVEKVFIPESVEIICPLAFDGCNKITEIKIPDTVRVIGWSAFGCCDSLQYVSIPNAVTCIERYTCFRCSSLRSVKLPKKLKNIDDNAFSGCKSLQAISIPDSLIYLGDHAFECCESLKSIILPDSVEYLGKFAFYGCI